MRLNKSVCPEAMAGSVMEVKVLVAQLCPWNSPGKNTGVGCYSFLQGIFLTQGRNLGLLQLQASSLSSEPPEKPLHLLKFAFAASFIPHFPCLALTDKALLPLALVSREPGSLQSSDLPS